MKKVSIKIILSLFVVFFITAIIPRVIIYMLRDLPARDIFESEIFLLGMAMTAALTLLLFAAAMNVILVKRVKKLSEATREVAQGNYDIHLIQEGKDEISSLTKDFNTMVESLKSNAYLSKEFVRNFSHEFKTPISAIKGYAELIALGNLSKEELEEYSKIIIEESTRLSGLSKNMLQISYLDSTKIIKKEDTYNLAEQIRSVIQLMQLEWEEKRIEFNLELSEFKIKSNKELTYQIWKNLIENAIHYSHEHGKIDIKLIQTDLGMTFTIQDYGTGIKVENQPHLFQPFFIADETRSKKSTGLGLSITKKIVEMLGGKITFESVEQKYTLFEVKL